MYFYGSTPVSWFGGESLETNDLFILPENTAYMCMYMYECVHCLHRVHVTDPICSIIISFSAS